MNFKIHIEKSTPAGKISATYRLEHLHSTGDDSEQRALLAELAMVGDMEARRGLVVRIDEIP